MSRYNEFYVNYATDNMRVCTITVEVKIYIIFNKLKVKANISF